MTDAGAVLLSLEAQKQAQRARALAVEKALKAGVKPSVIAERYAMSPAYVSRIARQCGVGPHGVNRARHAAIAADYASGMPLKAICQKFAVGRRTVWTACEKTGTPLRRPTIRSKPR